MSEEFYEPARQPQDLSRLFIERLNDGDVDRLLLLYTLHAVVIINSDTPAQGVDSIRELFERIVYQLIIRNIVFAGSPPITVIYGDLALTTRRYHVTYDRLGDNPTVRSGGASEVAQRQADGTWLLIMAQTSFDTP